jgi:hypothetical protein
VSEIGPWAMGKAQGLTGGPQPFTGAEQAMGQTQELLTYPPKTEFGKFVTESANAPFAAVSQGADVAAKGIFPKSEEGQAATRLATGLALNALLFKGGAKIVKGEPLFAKGAKPPVEAPLKPGEVPQKAPISEPMPSQGVPQQESPLPPSIPTGEPSGIPGEFAPPKGTFKGGPESGTLAYGQKLPPKIGNTNLERIINEGLTPEAAGEEVYGTKKVLEEALRDTQQERRAKGVGVTKTWAKANEGADVLGKEFSAEEVAKKFGLKTDNLDEVTMAARNTVVTLSNRVREMVKAASENGSEENMAHMAVARATLEKTLVELSSGSANVGRALAIHKQLSQTSRGK